MHTSTKDGLEYMSFNIPEMHTSINDGLEYMSFNIQDTLDHTRQVVLYKTQLN